MHVTCTVSPHFTRLTNRRRIRFSCLLLSASVDYPGHALLALRLRPLVKNVEDTCCSKAVRASVLLAVMEGMGSTATSGAGAFATASLGAGACAAANTGAGACAVASLGAGARGSCVPGGLVSARWGACARVSSTRTCDWD